MPDPIYCDTCVFIEILQQANASRFDACDELRRLAERKDLVIVTSSVTIAEFNKMEKENTLTAKKSREILDFFENEYIAIRSADRRTAEYAHELAREHGLMPLDAIHVATAILSRASVFYTYDGAKGRRKGLLRHNLEFGTPPLRIVMPPDPMAGTLFDEDRMAKGSTSPTIGLPFEGDVAASAPSLDDDKSPSGKQSKK